MSVESRARTLALLNLGYISNAWYCQISPVRAFHRLLLAPHKLARLAGKPP